MNDNLINAMDRETRLEVSEAIAGLTFTKNFRSPTAEEWYVFLPGYRDPQSGGAAGKVIIHYNIYDTKYFSINTTIIWDDPALCEAARHKFVYAVCDEIVNRLVGYADTLLSVHAGGNSYQAEYRQ